MYESVRSVYTIMTVVVFDIACGVESSRSAIVLIRFTTVQRFVKYICTYYVTLANDPESISFRIKLTIFDAKFSSFESLLRI